MGNPTKAQGFKNKTSKELNVFLYDEMKWKEIGAVVHDNPCVGWTSGMRPSGAVQGSQAAQVTDQEWTRKRTYIQSVRLPTLKARKYDERLRFGHMEYAQIEGPCSRLKARRSQTFGGKTKQYFVIFSTDHRPLRLSSRRN